MKTLIKTVFLAVAMVFCAALAAPSYAQCVNCAPAPPSGFVCVPSAMGGNGCSTDGGSCSLVGGPCVPDKDAPEGRAPESCKLKLLKNSQVSVADSFIREVGGIDPRLAIALLNVSRIKAEFTFARINFSSLIYTFEDVDNHITQSFDSPYFKQIKKLSAEHLTKDGIVITYEVLISENRGGSYSLTISPLNGGTAIELNLQPATFGTGKNQSEGFKATSYQFK